MADVPFLSPEEGRLLVVLADPDAAPPNIDVLEKVEPERFFAAADIHGVMPIVCRKLHMGGEGVAPAYREWLAGTADSDLMSAAVMMDLDNHGRQITQALDGAGVQYRMVKGQSFARDLYAHATDRPYTDIDLVVAVQDLRRAVDLAEPAGFTVQNKATFDNSERNQEYKLVVEGVMHILVELHGNLVHMPALRRRKPISYDELATAYDWPTPFVGHFVVAVAHAALGHKFHCLKLLVDVAQARRKLTSEDTAFFGDVIDRLKIGFEVSTCLSLTDELFGRNSFPILGVERALPTPSRWVRDVDVVQAPLKAGFYSKWRRRMFRLHQLLDG